jgi:citrate lyase alpha subunit
LDEDTSSIDILKERFQLLIRSDLKLVDKIHQLIEDCRRFGTLAFSHAARAGFVSVTLLKNLVKIGGFKHLFQQSSVIFNLLFLAMICVLMILLTALAI